MVEVPILSSTGVSSLTPLEQPTKVAPSTTSNVVPAKNDLNFCFMFFFLK
jgi:hypothetical protein